MMVNHIACISYVVALPRSSSKQGHDSVAKLINHEHDSEKQGTLLIRKQARYQPQTNPSTIFR